MHRSSVVVASIFLAWCAVPRRPILNSAVSSGVQGRPRLLNTDSLNGPVGKETVFLQPDNGANVTPVSIWAEVNEGRYTAVLLIYPDTVTLETAEQSVDSMYGTRHHLDSAQMTIRRNSSGRFAVVLYKQAPTPRIGYFAFRPADQTEQKIQKLAACCPPDEAR